jgi:hypothetical protein
MKLQAEAHKVVLYGRRPYFEIMYVLRKLHNILYC